MAATRSLLALSGFSLWLAPLAAPLAAQSTRLNGPLAPGRGSLETFRIAPDGNTVVYSAQQDSSDYDIYRVALGGGASTRVNTPSPGTFLEPLRFEITPDSAHVVFTTFGAANRDLFAAPLAGGPAVELDDDPLTDGRLVDQSFALAPNGQRVVYVIEAAPGQRRLASTPITGGAPALLAGPASVGRPLLSPDSSVAVFLADLDVPGRSEVYRVPLDGSAAPVRLSPSPTRNGDAANLALTPDGLRVVFASTLDTVRPVLYSVPLAGGPALALDPPTTSSVAPVPVPTADGARVLFQDGVGLVLFSAPVDGSASAVPLAPSLRIDAFRSSPDGSRVVFAESSSSAGSRLFGVPAVGGELVQLSSPGFISGADFQITPDGAHVIYRARPEGTSTSNLYRVPIAGGESVELHAGVQSWVLAPDGSRVALVDASTAETLSVSTADGRARSVFPFARQYAFSPDSQRLLLMGTLAPLEPLNLYRTGAAGQGRLVQLNGALADLPANSGVSGFELQVSEKRVLYQAREAVPGAQQLFSVESSGLDHVRLDPRVVDGQATVVTSRLTPDGARAVFAHVAVEGFALYATRIEGGPARRLMPLLPTTPDHFGLGFPNVPYAVAPDSRAAAFVADLEGDGQRDLYRVRLKGGNPRRLNPPLAQGGDVRDFAFAPAGGRVVYRADQDLEGQIELYSVVPALGPASAVRLSAPLDSTSDVDGFRIDPTGARVVYRTEGTPGLFVAPTDGLFPAAEILLADGTAVNLFRDAYVLSADGARVVIPAGATLHSAPLAGGPTVELGADLASQGIAGFTLAPDSSRVAFSAFQATGDTRLYTAPLAGGPSAELALEGRAAQFTNASDRVLYLAPTGFTAGLFVVSATGGASTPISGGLPVRTFAVRADDQLVGFTTEGGALYVARLDGQGSPQVVNEFAAQVADSFVLGSERVFYLASPALQLEPKELFSRPYPSLP